MLHNLKVLSAELRETMSEFKLDLDRGVAVGTSVVI